MLHEVHRRIRRLYLYKFMTAMLITFGRTKTRVTAPRAAEQDDHEANEAEVIFGPLKVFAYLFLTISIRADANELRAKLGLQLGGQVIDFAFRHAQQHLAHHAAAEREQTGLRQVLVIDEHSRTETERAQRASRLRRNHAANRELRSSNDDLITNGQSELREKLRADERTVVDEECM